MIPGSGNHMVDSLEYGNMIEKEREQREAGEIYADDIRDRKIEGKE